MVFGTHAIKIFVAYLPNTQAKGRESHFQKYYLLASALDVSIHSREYPEITAICTKSAP